MMSIRLPSQLRRFQLNTKSTVAYPLTCDGISILARPPIKKRHRVMIYTITMKCNENMGTISWHSSWASYLYYLLRRQRETYFHLLFADYLQYDGRPRQRTIARGRDLEEFQFMFRLQPFSHATQQHACAHDRGLDSGLT